MCRVAVVLLLASILLEPKLVNGSGSISSVEMHRLAMLSVKPETTFAPPPIVGDTFRDSIYVANIEGVRAWQCVISYAPSVLRIDTLVEGPFMKDAYLTTFSTYVDDTTVGKVMAGCAFYGNNVTSGSGAILYIRWQVKSGGNSPIHISREGEYFFETCFLDVLYDYIPFDTVDGYFKWDPDGIEETFLNKSNESWLQNYPNPFTKSTVISYQLAVASIRDPVSIIQLTIYDLTGRLVRTFPISARLTLGFELGSRSSGREARRSPIPNFQFPILLSGMVVIIMETDYRVVSTFVSYG